MFAYEATQEYRWHSESLFKRVPKHPQAVLCIFNDVRVHIHMHINSGYFMDLYRHIELTWDINEIYPEFGTFWQMSHFCRRAGSMNISMSSGSGHAYGSMLISACFPMNGGRMAGTLPKDLRTRGARYMTL